MFTLAKDWLLKKLSVIKIGLAVLVILSILFLYVQNMLYRKDILRFENESIQKNEIIRNQVVIISAQDDTITLVRDMVDARNTELKKFSNNVDSKIKPMNELIDQIKQGKFGISQCQPASSVKVVIDRIQQESKK